MEIISASTGVEIGLVITVLGGLLRMDRRFNKLEDQVRAALKDRMSRTEHRIWVLEFRLRNPALNFPESAGGDPDSNE